MTERPLPDEKDLAMYRLGFDTALEMVEKIARKDHRVEMAKRCGYVPGWQRGRWLIAESIASIRKLRAQERDAV